MYPLFAVFTSLSAYKDWAPSSGLAGEKLASWIARCQCEFASLIWSVTHSWNMLKTGFEKCEKWPTSKPVAICSLGKGTKIKEWCTVYLEYLWISLNIFEYLWISLNCISCISNWSILQEMLGRLFVENFDLRRKLRAVGGPDGCTTKSPRMVVTVFSCSTWLYLLDPFGSFWILDILDLR